MIQNLAPSTIMWRQCDIRIPQDYKFVRICCWASLSWSCLGSRACSFYVERSLSCAWDRPSCMFTEPSEPEGSHAPILPDFDREKTQHLLLQKSLGYYFPPDFQTFLRSCVYSWINAQYMRRARIFFSSSKS